MKDQGWGWSAQQNDCSETTWILDSSWEKYRNTQGTITT